MDKIFTELELQDLSYIILLYKQYEYEVSRLLNKEGLAKTMCDSEITDAIHCLRDHIYAMECSFEKNIPNYDISLFKFVLDHISDPAQLYYIGLKTNTESIMVLKYILGIEEMPVKFLISICDYLHLDYDEFLFHFEKSFMKETGKE